MKSRALAIAALLCALAWGDTAWGGAVTVKERLTGSYALTDPGAFTEGIREAVDRATERMPLLKGLARSRLYETSEPAPRVEVRFPEGQILVAYLGEEPVVTPDDGTPTRWKSRFGDTTTVVQTLYEGSLFQYFAGAMGSKRTDIYTVSSDGRHLTVRSSITSAFLPEAVEFQVVYDRESRSLEEDPP